ncbi:SDR family oxidoreductase [Bradyrhizobium manausense]|uniref:SDR family oxidoreductase n=1 Tax=Bradyrhizobium manausense TaxID=989370 RepID=UPI001BA85597|nr:SDR family oxidoreductase [Bradyrhizobium manausense]MBR1088490.1 SDR family oxidoreductase [Bradyrhizobium manausense]
MNLGLENRVALVLGAGGGLGRAIAVALAREGASVALADISAGAVTETVAAIEALPPRASGQRPRSLSLVFDLAETAAIGPQLARIERELAPIDVLVNNTGGPPPATASGQDVAAWQRAFEMMVISVIAVTDQVLPGMRARRFGRVITSTSSGVIAPIPNLAFSNALRSALLGWSKTLATEVAADGVTANVVIPGRIATARTQFLDEQKARRQNRSAEDIAMESANAIPLKRYGRPEEYADAVAFLASERASYITGSVIRVDGGLLANI